MIIRLNTPTLPRDWSTMAGSENLLFQTDIAVSPASTLRAKTLLFENLDGMNRFWRLALERPPLSKDTMAVCNPLTVEVHFSKVKGKPQRQPELRVDPRYFCVIGLVNEHLSREFIVHESVHAAFAYSRRVRGKHRWFDDDKDGEERICYPAGRIASDIIGALREKGFLS
jgi:hypothetical protein